MNCDRCTNAARWLIGNMETGKQEALCDEHRDGEVIVQAAAPAPVADPNDGIPETTVCEICGIEPLTVIWDLPDHSTKMYLGHLCAGVMARVAYLQSSGDEQEMVNAGAEQQISTMRGGRKVRKPGAKLALQRAATVASNGTAVQGKTQEEAEADAALAEIHDVLDPED